MRLKHLHIIGEYKNLKDFKLDFDGTSFIDVFVGKNGTGKSNLFEAFLEIFKHLYDNNYPIGFNYKLHYEIGGKTIELHWEDPKWQNKLDNNEKVPAPIAPNLLPSNLLIYYSGHNDTIGNFIEDFNETHRDRLNRNRNNENFNSDDARLFFGIGKEYKTILLATTLLQSDDLHLKQIIKQKLSIDSVGSEIKLVFEKPFFASKDSTFDEFEPDARFWGAQGYFRGILNEIWDVNKIENTPVRDEGRIEKEDSEEYILYRSFEDFKNKFAAKTIFEVFITLDNLKTIGLLKDIDIEVTLISGKKISLGQFSDGQFQSVYILSITEIFKELNCISLLDEPDAFLHPEWQFTFFDQLNAISDTSSRSNHLLMSSHSAISLLQSDKRTVNLFKIENDSIVNRVVRKDYAVNQLSSNLLNLKNEKHILSVIHTLGQQKPILFTEGYSDPIILRKAYHMLYDSDDIPFEICFGHGCEYLRKLLQNEKFLNEMNGKPIFGLFDFDEAYSQWNSIKTNKNLLVDNHFEGLVKQYNDKESYAILIPIPLANTLHPQVLEPAGHHFGDRSNLEMEHLFYSPASVDYFVSRNVVGGGSIIEISDNKKMNFATEYIPTLEKAEFEIFRPMFEFIKIKISNS